MVGVHEVKNVWWGAARVGASYARPLSPLPPLLSPLAHLHSVEQGLCGGHMGLRELGCNTCRTRPRQQRAGHHQHRHLNNRDGKGGGGREGVVLGCM